MWSREALSTNLKIGAGPLIVTPVQRTHLSPKSLASDKTESCFARLPTLVAIRPRAEDGAPKSRCGPAAAHRRRRNIPRPLSHFPHFHPHPHQPAPLLHLALHP